MYDEQGSVSLILQVAMTCEGPGYEVYLYSKSNPRKYLGIFRNSFAYYTLPIFIINLKSQTMTDLLLFSYLCANYMGLRFNLKMTDLGLVNEDRIILGDNSMLLTFLRLDKDKILSFKQPIECYRYIAESPYFNDSVFKLRNIGVANIKSLPPSIKTLLLNFRRYLNEQKPPSKYYYVRYPEIYNKVVDTFIKRYNLTNSVMPISSLKKQLAEKLNGELVMEWLPDVKPGKLLGDMLKQFKESIEIKCPYDVYLFNNSKETVKNDFKLFFIA